MEHVPRPSIAVADVGGDGRFTVSDLLPWLHAAFFLPGDWLIWTIVVHFPSLAAFLEIDAADYGGLASGVLSACAWLMMLVAGSIAYQWVRAADRALTDGIVGAYAGILRKIRIALALLVGRLRRRKQRQEQAAPAAPLRDDVRLSAEEIRTLQLHALLESGYALAVSDVARGLGTRKEHAQDILARLNKLGLIESTVGGLDGENTYLLTRTGVAYLAMRQAAREKK